MCDAGEPIPVDGVSVKVLHYLINKIGRDNLKGLTTSEVCEKFVKPQTEAMKVSLMEWVRAQPVSETGVTPSEISPANAFVSHAWKYKFLDMVDVLIGWCERESGRMEKTRFWFDIVVNNQHGAGERPFEWWKTTFTRSVESIGCTLVVMSPWDDPIYVRRAWCLFEFYVTSATKTKMEILLTKGDEAKFVDYLIDDFDVKHGGVYEKISHIDIEKAEAFKQTDLDAIKEIVRTQLEGGFARLNGIVFDELRKWIVAVGRKALGEMKEDSARKRRLQHHLAFILGDMGHHEESLSMHQELLDLKEADGQDTEEYAASLNATAVMLKSQGQFEQAEPLYKQSLAIFENLFGKDHPSVAISINNLAELYRAQGKFADAEPLYKRSLEIRENTHGKDHPSVAIGLNNLAGLYKLQGRHADAEALYRRSLEIDEKAEGKDHPFVARDLNNLAGLYKAQGKFTDAEPLYKRSLEIFEKVHGRNHPSVATTLCNLALLYKVQGRFSDAAPLYEQSLEIDEKVHGKDHPSVAMDLNNLGAFYFAQGEYRTALPLLERALSIRLSLLGSAHPDTIATEEWLNATREKI
jgi:tetratricopeptide (TPR) repeat protein